MGDSEGKYFLYKKTPEGYLIYYIEECQDATCLVKRRCTNLDEVVTCLEDTRSSGYYYLPISQVPRNIKPSIQKRGLKNKEDIRIIGAAPHLFFPHLDRLTTGYLVPLEDQVCIIGMDEEGSEIGISHRQKDLPLLLTWITTNLESIDLFTETEDRFLLP